MKTEDYKTSITANVTAHQAFDGICRVSEWWATGFEGNARNLNDTFTVRFEDTFATFNIVEVVPDKKIVWLVTDCHLSWIREKKEWKGTTVSWEISPAGSATRIDMTHIGLVPEAVCYTDCKKGWDHFVTESLFKLLTEGTGLPE